MLVNNKGKKMAPKSRGTCNAPPNKPKIKDTIKSIIK